MRTWSRLRIVLVVLLAVALIGGGITAFLIWRSSVNAARERDFKAATRSAWKKIEAGSQALSEAMLKVVSPEDLPAVAAAAAAMSDEVTSARNAARKVAVPPGYAEVAEKQAEGFDALRAYLDLLNGLAESANRAEIEGSAQTLDDKARRSQDAVNEFTSTAPWLDSTVTGDVYTGSSVLRAAYVPPDPTLEARRQSAYDAVNAFMDADINRHDFNYIWSNLSSRLRAGFEFYKVTPEKLAEGWAKSWGKDPPKSYYISTGSIQFPSPGTAMVRVIAYLESGKPQIEYVKVVDEGGWKIDTYPYAGILNEPT